MDKRDENVRCIEEIKTIIIKEKGHIFWEEFIQGIEQSQRKNFMDGYKYAIRILEDTLVSEE